jgi:hypothetical protein
MTKIAPSGYLMIFFPKEFIQWSVDQHGFWEVELIVID